MTDEQRWLSKRYIAYKALTNVWFFGAVWLYFYRIFITDQQVGLLDGMAFAIGLLAEIPSGALADMFGWDKLVRLGQLLIGGGIFIQAVGSSFMPFFVGQAIMMVGFAFVSGADEALFFERLAFKRKSASWRKLITRGSQIALIATLLATAIGGWLHTINPRLPWYMTSFAFIFSIVVIWPVKDGRSRSVHGKFKEEVKRYVRDIKTGFAQFRLPKLWPYVPLIVVVQALFYAHGYGLLRLILLDRFTFSPFWGAIAVATCGLITIAILQVVHTYADRIIEKRALMLISLSAAASLILAVADIGLWGYFVILALHAGEYVMQPFMSEILNTHAPEQQRATVLSVGSFLKILPYALLAPFIGYLSTHRKLEYFLWGWALLIGLAVFVYLSAVRRNKKLQSRAELA